MGGLSGALGGMLMAKYASHILQTVGSYTPIFAVAGVAYFVALLTIHLLAPTYAPARLPGEAVDAGGPLEAPAP
jgi:ACS family hexuronate transporter-like MFS transporter